MKHNTSKTYSLSHPVSGTGLLCKKFLVFPLLLLFLPTGYAVETGVYHCTPAHSVHYLTQSDGQVTEQFVNNENAMVVITIENDGIHIMDTRASKRKSIDVVNNVSNGSVTGKSGLRLFYMDTALHYFYGSGMPDGSAAFAEDGRCQRF